MRKDCRPVRMETMCPQTQCRAKCWPAPGPLGSQALDLCTRVRHPSTAWFSPGRGRLVSRGVVGSPAVSGHCFLPSQAWPCLWGSWGGVGCLPGLDPTFPAFAWGAWPWGVAVSCTCRPCSPSLPFVPWACRWVGAGRCSLPLLPPLDPPPQCTDCLGACCPILHGQGGVCDR